MDLSRERETQREKEKLNTKSIGFMLLYSIGHYIAYSTDRRPAG